MPDQIVTTTAGPVRGDVDDGIAVFKGIGYGTAARFMAPEPLPAWTEVRDALTFGHRSPQLGGTNAAMGGADDAATMSEECLALNVWTPTPDDGARPVMVWFHGGGFSSLSGSSAMYDGVRLCQRGDVVVVTLNHRLNLFGFCYLAQLGGERYAHSGNAGMLDLVLALRWVRDNIARFGGDPHNVTVFGESGGGAKVSVLMGMPEATGLFHRAIVQSGVHLHAQDPDDATDNAKRLMAALDLRPDQVDELAALPHERLVEAFATIAPNAGGDVAFSPVADGVHLPREPWKPHAPECSADVPLLILSTRTETTLLAGGRDPSLFSLDDERLPRKLRGWLGGADPEPIVEGFRHLYPEASPSELFWLITSDMYSRLPGWVQADLKSDQGGAPVWMCEVHWDSPVQGGRWGSPHTIDIPLVFDNVTKVASFAKDGPEAREVAAQMSEAWIAFARSGDPNHPGIPEWPPYRSDAPCTMLFDVPPRAEPGWRSGERAVLADVPPRDTNR
ncbi:MAG: carboxylesterase/lipase family protein [Acidimicrobiia bacterium]|nr:carboxylesterase/lipase family protein [Acidimicrobiia bacterium]